MGALDRSAKLGFTSKKYRRWIADRCALARAIILGTVNDKARITGLVSEDARSIEAFFVDVNGVHGTIVRPKR